jgi:hypothetical protein
MTGVPACPTIVSQRADCPYAWVRPSSFPVLLPPRLFGPNGFIRKNSRVCPCYARAYEPNAIHNTNNIALLEEQSSVLR